MGSRSAAPQGLYPATAPCPPAPHAARHQPRRRRPGLPAPGAATRAEPAQL